MQEQQYTYSQAVAYSQITLIYLYPSFSPETLTNFTVERFAHALGGRKLEAIFDNSV